MGSRRFEITETAGSVKGFYVVVTEKPGSITLWQSLELAGVFVP